MNWTNIELEKQTAVLDKLRLLSTENEELSDAYSCAADELELWLHSDLVASPFTAWLEEHANDLEPFAGKAVAVHMNTGVVADADVSTFWDGSFQKKVLELFKNDPDIYITTLPDKNVPNGEENGEVSG